VSVRKAVAVKPAPVRNRHDYTYYAPTEIVQKILRKYQKKGDLMYEIKLTDGITKQVRFIMVE
jgi:chromodomain-helicase-DNA-binding protein 4